jgi:peptidoglycan hydrolase FlgJ
MDGPVTSLSPAAGASLATPPSASDGSSVQQAAKNFEAFFLSQTFQSMFSDVGTDSLFGGGDGEKIYRSMLLQQYSEEAAKRGGIGIADAVQREMLQLQEVH